MIFIAVVLLMVLGAAGFGASDAAQDSQVNCNEVDPEDRCACNIRVLNALAHIRPVVTDPVQSPNATEGNTQIAVQLERQHRLRTFIAPSCELDSSPVVLPRSNANAPSIHAGVDGNRLRPLGAFRLDEKIYPNEKTDVPLLLKGRWEGWQTLSDGKANPLFLHVIDVQGFGNDDEPYYVKACSDQGMVLGRVKDGVLEFSRSESPALVYSIRLWKSGPPRPRDLEGVALLEMRPKQAVVAGLVWLSRTPHFVGAVPASEYPCKDRALEEEKLTRDLKPPLREQDTGELEWL